MTKQELEKAIENGESVWYITGKDVRGLKITKKDLQRITKFDEVYKTKAEAEHYLHHANVTRTETLPFVTWEEFKNEKELFFTNKSGYPMCLCIIDTKLGKKIGLGGANGYFDLQQYWDLTEENFYKAYDECIRLFKGGEL